MNSLKNWIKTYRISICGVLLGTAAGLMYWKFVGCHNGTCAVASNPYFSAIFGAVSGSAIADLISGRKKEKALPPIESGNPS